MQSPAPRIDVHLGLWSPGEDRIGLASHCPKRLLLNQRMSSLEIGWMFIMLYAPQQGRSTEEKDELYLALQETFDAVKYRDDIIVLGDWNRHIGTERGGIESVIGPFSIGNRNIEGGRIIEFCTTNMLAIMNTF